MRASLSLFSVPHSLSCLPLLLHFFLCVWSEVWPEYWCHGFVQCIWTRRMTFWPLFFPPHCQLLLRSEAAERKQAQLPEQGGLVSTTPQKHTQTHTRTQNRARQVYSDEAARNYTRQSGWKLKETSARKVRLFSVMANDSVGTAIGMHEEKEGGRRYPIEWNQRSINHSD